MDKPTFDCWAIVELFGRQVIAGRVTEQVISSQGFVRVDVPAVADQEGYTRLFGPGAIYCITPTTEQIATMYVARNVGAPIKAYQLQLPERVQEDDHGMDYEREDDDMPF